MPRGPRIKEEEINKARALRADGKTIKEIALEMGRSKPTVLKMLKPLERPEV